jgi:hypothetical protein
MRLALGCRQKAEFPPLLMPLSNHDDPKTSLPLGLNHFLAFLGIAWQRKRVCRGAGAAEGQDKVFYLD